MQFASKIAETESWKFSANSASLHLCVKNLWDGNVKKLKSWRVGGVVGWLVSWLVAGGG